MQRKCGGANAVAPAGPSGGLVTSSVLRCQADTVQTPVTLQRLRRDPNASGHPIRQA